MNENDMTGKNVTPTNEWSVCRQCFPNLQRHNLSERSSVVKIMQNYHFPETCKK
jgi:hypothetical protein